MSETHELPLPGCTPEPLMSYLKALGILRLVSEQADPNATACWRNDQFVLYSKFDNRGLASFFLTEYQPTPILAPWNAGCGFYKKWEPKKNVFKSRDVVEAVDAIEVSTNTVFEPYRNQIRTTKRALEERGKRVDISAELDAIRRQGEEDQWSANKLKEEISAYLDNSLLFEVGGQQVRIEKAEKDEFVRAMRSEVLADESLQWLDAALVLLTGQKKNRIEAPVLGSGGNIGNSDFSARFMQLLLQALPTTEGNQLPKDSETLLRASIYGDSVSGLLNYAVDQFNPGIAGGANMGQGMEARPALNPWDYILMIEGAILMAGAVSRRLDANRTGSAFPFSVDSTPVGFASAGEDDTRGELWLPLWSRACSLKEFSHLLAEGRAEIGGRRPRNGVEFARAIASFGTDRGVQSFVRIQFQKRLGDNFLATVLDKFNVRNHEDVRLLENIDWWLEHYRREATKKQKSGYVFPERFRSALRKIESAIFDYCRYGRREDIQAVLVALGRAERELAVTGGHRGGKEICPPLRNLSSEWLKATHDGSPEYDIALALAGIHDRENKIEPLRGNVEPLAVKHWDWTWQESGPHVVWSTTDLPANMAAVLGRRIMDGTRAGCENLPLDFKLGVSLDTIALFIAGGLDDRRIEEFLWGLVLVDHRQKYPVGLPHATIDDAPPLPREYALLKLLFLPRSLVRHWDGEYQRWSWRLARVTKGLDGKATQQEGLAVRPEPRVLPLLRAGRVPEACRIAYRRLRSSGLRPLPGPTPSRGCREADWEPAPFVKPQRLAAALLLPVGDVVVNQLVHLVTRQDSQPETESETLATEGVSQS